jgi:hypothetical protein
LEVYKKYSVATACKLQLLGLVDSNMNKIIWKAWASPKVKNLAWFALQSILWNDQLSFVNCCFTIRIWELIMERFISKIK